MNCKGSLLACHTNYYTVKLRANREPLQFIAAGKRVRAEIKAKYQAI
jgi:hypothetical protein